MMGSLFGGYLSLHNDVWLVDINEQRVNKIQEDGITILEKHGNHVYRPKAITNASSLNRIDLIIVFVKAMFTTIALSQNQNLISKNTYIMTLQNGTGYDEILRKFSDLDHILIGTTQHNSSITDDGCINHGGEGNTIIGLLGGNSEKIQYIADNFSNCGIQTNVSDGVKKQIWNKLFLNSAASSLTAILQVPLGYILNNPHACNMMERLACEAVAVANSECDYHFSPNEVIAEIKKVISNSQGGYTSIYMDLKKGMPTEVDTISGYVVTSAKKFGIAAPCHEFVVSMIHALEDRAQK
jgi:2-dehydropantoate 2-reductase